MRLKSYSAASLPEAIQLARAELGPDAVVLDSRPEDGGAGVRITAALGQTAPARPDDTRAGFTSHPDAPFPLDGIETALRFHRVPPGLAERLIAAAARSGARDGGVALAAALGEVLAFDGQAVAKAKGPILLVGPPGAGKTTTAAKLCALARLDGRPASLVTLDTVKAGALAQTAIPSAILSGSMAAALHEASDETSLLQAVAACEGKGLVLVDSIGANPFDADEQALLGRLAQAISAKVILVLPAGGDPMESADLALAFAEIGASLLCPTRLDASRRLGGLLSAAEAARLAFFAAGTAPQIVGGLAPLTPESLAAYLLNPRQAGAEPVTFVGAVQ